MNTFAAVLQESIQVCLMNIQEKIDKDGKIDKMKRLMKKTYVKPEAHVNEIEVCQMMAASDPTARTEKLQEEEYIWDEE